ncbi:MAG: acyltransferase [Planctomycetota bacterium]
MRRPELDGLRGVAVLLVVLSHASNRGLCLWPGLDLRGLGRTGVFLFFVLSSYLLTSQLLGRGAAELRRPRTWGRYAVRRLLRVYPGYLLALGVTLALGGMSAPHALEHLALVRAEAHFWTIPVEVLFYLALPPLALALTALPDARARVVLLVVLAAASRLMWPPDYPSQAPDYRPSVLPFLVVFLMGSLVAVLAHGSAGVQPGAATGFAASGPAPLGPAPLGPVPSGPVPSGPAPSGAPPSGGSAPRWPRWVGVASVAGLIALTPAVASAAVGRRLPHTEFHLWFGVLGALSAGLVLAVVAADGALRRAVAFPPLAAVGRASYSVYLLHAVPLAYVVERGPRGPAGAWAILCASLVLGGLSYALVERPFQGAARRP